MNSGNVGEIAQRANAMLSSTTPEILGDMAAVAIRLGEARVAGRETFTVAGREIMICEAAILLYVAVYMAKDKNAP